MVKEPVAAQEVCRYLSLMLTVSWRPTLFSIVSTCDLPYWVCSSEMHMHSDSVLVPTSVLVQLSCSINIAPAVRFVFI